ncbi:sugar transferase [Candidatus Fermentibacterales bacterium]|nr:sugar transferase [Candidatus Fermentibacterales bacterium]
MGTTRTAGLDRTYFSVASILDVALIAFCIALAMLIRFGTITDADLRPMIGTWVLMSVAVLTGSAVESLYVARTTSNRTLHFYRMARLALVTMAFYVLFVYAVKFPARLFVVSRAAVLLVFVLWLWLYLLLRILLLPHLVTLFLKLSRRKRISLLFCGDDRAIRRVGAVFRKSPIYRHMIVPVGSCDACGLPMDERLGFYMRRAEELGATQICVVDEQAEYGDIAAFVMECRKRGIPLVFYSPHFRTLRYYDPWLSFEDIGAMPFLYGPWSATAEVAWRVVDLVFASIAVLVLSPLLLAIAIAVKLSGRGPVLFVQERVCRDMKRLRFPKFRSMTAGTRKSEEAHREYFRRYVEGKPMETDDNGEAVYKLDQRQRITAVGRIIRKTSLDELPQVFCVISGSMSLVGPRPCIPYELEHYSDWQKQRFTVKPGLTGVWQVYGRSRLPFGAAQFLDFCYVFQRSFSMNVRLVLKTFPVILFGRGGM